MADLTSALKAAAATIPTQDRIRSTAPEGGDMGGMVPGDGETCPPPGDGPTSAGASSPRSSSPTPTPLTKLEGESNRRRIRSGQRSRAKTKFCEALAEFPLVGRAARLGGHRLETFHRWRDDDRDFGVRWDEAHLAGVERLELRVHEDALEGTDREATLQRMFALKRHMPEYREGYTVTHRNEGSGALEAAVLRRAVVEALAPYPEARAALAAVLARLTGSDGEHQAGADVETVTPRVPVLQSSSAIVTVPCEVVSDQVEGGDVSQASEAAGEAAALLIRARGGAGVRAAIGGTTSSAGTSESLPIKDRISNENQ